MGSNWLTLGYNDRFGEAELSGKHFTTNINWLTAGNWGRGTGLALHRSET